MNMPPVTVTSVDLYASLGKVAANIGVPAVLALIILLRIEPDIHEGIRIAENVNAQLLIMNTNCVALTRLQQPIQPPNTP